MPIEGLETLQSAYDWSETSARLTRSIAAHGMSIFARIDHAAGAAEVGMPLRPTEVLIFGSPRGGTPLMQINQTLGIDLPLRVLIWEDESGKTWLSFHRVSWLTKRLPADATTAAIAAKLDSVQQQVALDATSALP